VLRPAVAVVWDRVLQVRPPHSVHRQGLGCAVEGADRVPPLGRRFSEVSALVAAQGVSEWHMEGRILLLEVSTAMGPVCHARGPDQMRTEAVRRSL
jgi:hypothetical protein